MDNPDAEFIPGASSRRRNASSPLPPRSSKKSRLSNVQGSDDGTPAPNKRINAGDLDEDDRIILDMKSKGYKDDVVAQALRDAGGMVYADKTISTRYTRIKRAIRVLEEESADLEFDYFSEEHDGMLIDFFEEARAEIHNELELLHMALLERVYDKMKAGVGAAKYSRRHLEARYHDLMTGTASLPPELDENPEQRTAEATARIADRKLAKEWAEDQSRFEKAEKERKIDEEQRAVADAKSKREELKELAKAEKELALMKKESESDKREHRQRAQELAKQRKKEEQIREVERKKQEEEEKREAQAKARRQLKEDREARVAQKKLDEANRVREAKEAQLKAIRNRNICREVLFETMRRSKVEETDQDGLDDLDEDDGPAMTPKYSSEAKQAAENASSPRTFMPIEDLRKLATSRQLSPTGTKEDLVKRLAEADNKLTVPKLQEVLENRGLKKGGMKMELLRRLAAADAGELVALTKPRRKTK